ncbi:MAG: histidine kinase dimerization/phosphoacceptor domain-containing protein, partial [Acidimicrobiaceae bacterium]|nr:histidine kinase dimerization/phosphoacceptor domain-containing protein [Acidimicrobiaceae bacterium]
MYASNDNSGTSRSVVLRFLVRSWEYRRPRLWIGVRLACGIFNLALGVLLLGLIHWIGALAWLAVLPLAGAALIFWTVYRLQQDSVRRVRELEQSRAHVVDDSAARLRRIERDLHDGAQAEMVAVTMKLGLAVKKLSGMTDGTGQTDLYRVLDLVVAAHRGAKEAVTELRNLARGIHPPVL